MPCFDKKLEASREQFADGDTGSRDVVWDGGGRRVPTGVFQDVVISSVEILDLLQSRQIDFLGLTASSFDLPVALRQQPLDAREPLPLPAPPFF